MLPMVLTELSFHCIWVLGDSPLAFSTVKAFLWGAPTGGQGGSGVVYGSERALFPPQRDFG